MSSAQGDLLDLFRANDPETEQPIEDHFAVLCPWKKLSGGTLTT